MLFLFIYSASSFKNINSMRMEIFIVLLCIIAAELTFHSTQYTLKNSKISHNIYMRILNGTKAAFQCGKKGG